MRHLNIAVVGHTNTGKTSLLRTLLRDEAFGEVKNAPATTRHVQMASIDIDEHHDVQLFDTPGLEDAGGLLDWLQLHTLSQWEGLERLQYFLQDASAENEFAQEAKVLRQIIQSDAALYVIDAREPLLAKYKDELTVLSWCAKPVMPVFNFIDGADVSLWREFLAKRSLHVHSQFDTVAFDFDSEMYLWMQLDILLNHYPPLHTLQNKRHQQWQQLQQQAHECLAHFLLDVAAFRHAFEQQHATEPEIERMQTKVRQLEAHCQQQLLQLFAFYQQMNVSGQWLAQVFAHNPFDPYWLKQLGIRTTTAATVGALVGLGVDAATLGLSGGLGAAVGGLLGGMLGNAGSISDKIKGIKTLHIDDQTLVVLATRGKALIETLSARGHASQNALQLQSWQSIWPKHMPAVLKQARSHPHWSSLNGVSVAKAQENRHAAALQLATLLQALQVVPETASQALS